MKFVKGDRVRVIAGSDKGKEGVIDRIYTNSDKVLISNVNLVKKHIRKNQDAPQGAIIDMPKPIKACKIMLICPATGKVTRIGYKVDKGKKVRISKKSGKQISVK